MENKQYSEKGFHATRSKALPFHIISDYSVIGYKCYYYHNGCQYHNYTIIYTINVCR